MQQEQTQRKKRKKKVDTTEFDTYVANVSNGMNPPSAAKRRRKKKPDTDAYDRFLEESEPEVLSRRERRERAEAQEGTQMKMDLEAPAKKRRAKKQNGLPEEQAAGDDYDAYLLHSEEAEEAPAPRKPRRKKRGGKRRRRRKSRFGAYAYLALMVAVLCAFGWFGWQQVQTYRHYEEMRAVVEDARFYAGVQVDGVELTGMTLDEAMTFFGNSIEPTYRNRSVTLTTGEMLTAEQLGYASNYQDVLRAAWKTGRDGSLEERYEAIISGAHAQADFTVTRTFYTQAAIDAQVEAVAARIDQEQKDPQITGFDPETLEFTLDDGRPGYRLERERLAESIAYVMGNGGGNVETVINSIPVVVDADKLREGYGRISFISTDASTSSKNRLTNLYLSCQAINGLRLEPGEEFSFNGVVGRRTEAKGYKEAGVYNGGADGMDIGGGICQVGSTLFNAAVMADMEITDRQPHSKPVSYLPRGRDAAINWPNQDLKFVNTTDSPVYIVTRLTDDKQVECAVYGKLPEDGHTVIVDSKTYKTLPFETVLEVDTKLVPGQQEVKKGHKGYKAQAWKITLDKDGNEISREHLCYSTYDPKNEVIRYNPF